MDNILCHVYNDKNQEVRLVQLNTLNSANIYELLKLCNSLILKSSPFLVGDSKPQDLIPTLM